MIADHSAARRSASTISGCARLVSDHVVAFWLTLAGRSDWDLVAGKAFVGRVVAIDLTHRELATKRMVLRPLVTLQLDEPCLMPQGKELWWTKAPGGPAFSVENVYAKRVTLKASSSRAPLPDKGKEACFSVLHSKSFQVLLPAKDPWTHRATDTAVPSPIEDDLTP